MTRKAKTQADAAPDAADAFLTSVRDDGDEEVWRICSAANAWLLQQSAKYQQPLPLSPNQRRDTIEVIQMAAERPGSAVATARP
jgi:hypothetical protein